MAGAVGDLLVHFYEVWRLLAKVLPTSGKNKKQTLNSKKGAGSQSHPHMSSNSSSEQFGSVKAATARKLGNFKTSV
ncbi:unnamed protein product [Coccothraustes coccothraustes]